MAQKIFSDVVCDVIAIKSPAGRDYGQRFVAALPNMAGRTPRGEACTSFKPPYLVYDGVVTDASDIDRHLANLRDQGFAAN